MQGFRAAARIRRIISMQWMRIFARAAARSESAMDGETRMSGEGGLNHCAVNSSTVRIDEMTKLDAHKNAITAFTHFISIIIAVAVRLVPIAHHEMKRCRDR